MKTITPPLKWHGGKSYLARRVVALMPPRCKNPNAPAADDPGWLHYVEPYFGGGAVLLANDPEGISEVANDKNGALTNFWQVMKDRKDFKRFLRNVQSTPFSEIEYEAAVCCADLESYRPDGDVVGWAVNFFIRCRQSLAGRMAGFAPVTRNRTRSGMNEQVSAWLNAVEGLPSVHARLKRVLILNDDALTVIRQQDGPRTFFYLDPPYLHETRATTGEHAHEMTAEQHRQLLEVLSGVKGKFLLSGYPSPLYDSFEKCCKWKCRTFDLPNNAAAGDSKRRMTESLWCNF